MVWLKLDAEASENVLGRDDDRNRDPRLYQSQSWAVTFTCGLRDILDASQRRSSSSAVADVAVERTVEVGVVTLDVGGGVLPSPRDGVVGVCGEWAGVKLSSEAGRRGRQAFQRMGPRLIEAEWLGIECYSAYR